MVDLGGRPTPVKVAHLRLCHSRVFLAVAYAYNVATIAVFGNFSAPRYEDVFLLLPVMLGCLGAHFAIVTFRRRSMSGVNASG